jgi:hypothetical protein
MDQSAVFEQSDPYHLILTVTITFPFALQKRSPEGPKRGEWLLYEGTFLLCV